MPKQLNRTYVARYLVYKIGKQQCGGKYRLVEVMLHWKSPMAVLGMIKRSFIAEEKVNWCLVDKTFQEIHEISWSGGVRKRYRNKYVISFKVNQLLQLSWMVAEVNAPTNIHTMQNCGVGLIIRLETQRIFLIRVRNKQCAVCDQFPKSDPPEHTCYRNWNGSSSAMETDIIIEGFKEYIQQHGIKYTKFIGDYKCTCPIKQE